MRVDSGKGRPAVFQTENAEFDSPYPLQVLLECQQENNTLSRFLRRTETVEG